MFVYSHLSVKIGSLHPYFLWKFLQTHSKFRTVRRIFQRLPAVNLSENGTEGKEMGEWNMKRLDTNTPQHQSKWNQQWSEQIHNSFWMGMSFHKTSYMMG